ncbi:SH3 domain-containing protein [Novosphingobium ovatum]|nr:SH3 domain-containing protein [Novosphingobium ovatum]
MTVPVRGDLAHIRMAGRVFVPHYIIPMPHTARADTPVLAKIGGEVIATLPAGAVFDVLDVASGHAWGEVPGGAIGYVAADALENAA